MECTDRLAVGTKNDSGKQGWFSLPLEILEPLAAVTEFGASKYELFNMLKPLDNSNKRFWDGQMRHLKACQQDPLAINHEDGNVYHLAQAAFNSLLRLHHAIKERGHKHDYLKPNKNEEGLPSTGCDCSDSCCPCSCTTGEQVDNVQHYIGQEIRDFLAGFNKREERTIHHAVLPEDGISSTCQHEHSGVGNSSSRADGRDVQEGIERESLSCGGRGEKQRGFSGSAKTLGPSFQTSNSTGSAIGVDTKSAPRGKVGLPLSNKSLQRDRPSR